MNLNKRNISIAVIGKSSAGKSAFIRTFANNSQLIDSVGKGQTTRAYAEYYFTVDKGENDEQVYVRLMTQSEFVENRISQVMDKLHKEEDQVNIAWLREQFIDIDYNERMREIILLSDDFFNINEFAFLSNNAITNNINNLYDELKNKVLNKDSSIDNIEGFLKMLFEKIYVQILEEIVKLYDNKGVLTCDNNIYFFKFNLTSDNKDLLSLFLKVIKTEEKQKSYTSIVSKVRIVSGINDKYLNIFSELKINSLTLVDTFGLDHAESIGNDILQERFHRIFNVDYPDITAAFFVEALHAGASNDFKKSITLMYKTRPDIMSYIVATYIDENDNTIVEKYKDWFLSADKSLLNKPALNGKVIDILYNQNEFVINLRRSGISKTMADKRIEIMRKRFAPFCGEDSELNKRNWFQEMNIKSVKLVMQSIVSCEHLGDSYIDINNLLDKLSNGQVLREMIKFLVENVTENFRKKFDISASRTRGKLRENFENHIMGFNGSTLDVTWVRIFRDAYNEIFTKEITLEGKKGMLSDFWDIEGNSKIGFDEILNQLFPYIFKRGCVDTTTLGKYIRELNCSKCFKSSCEDKCIWKLFILLAGTDNFSNYQSEIQVGTWLTKLHNFIEKSNEKFYEQLFDTVKKCLETSFVDLCRQHNARVVSNKIISSEKAFIDIKNEVYEEIRKLDTNLNNSDFNRFLNSYLCEA